MVQYNNAANPDQTDFYFSSSGQMKTDLRDMNMSGFDAWTGAGNYYSLAATDFTLLRGGSGYIKGDYVTWLGSQSTGALAAGALYWVYIDSTGTIGSTSTFSQALFTDNIPLFEVLVTASSDVIVVKENHPYGFPTLSSLFAHNVIGTALGGAGAEITLSGTDEIQIVGADVLYDHGLDTTIPDSGAAAVNFSFMFTDGTGKWDRDSVGTNFLSEYNAAGTMTALTAGKYGVWRIEVSKDDLNSSTPTYYALAHTAQYNNLTQAQNAIATGIVEPTAELANLELAQLGYVIYEESTSSIVSVIIEKDTLRGTAIGASNANTAALITTDTSSFGGILSAADTTMQAALNTIDNYTPPTQAPGVLPTFDLKYSASVWQPTQIIQSVTNGAQSDDRLVLHPFFISKTITLNNLGVNVGGPVAGSQARLGLYSMNPTTGAFTLVADYGTVATTASGMASVAATTTLTAGTLYFTAMTCDNNGGSLSMVVTTTKTILYYIAFTPYFGWYKDGVDPADALSANYAVADLANISTMTIGPVIWYR